MWKIFLSKFEIFSGWWVKKVSFFVRLRVTLDIHKRRDDSLKLNNKKNFVDCESSTTKQEIGVGTFSSKKNNI